jgi:hypothetical protein
MTDELESRLRDTLAQIVPAPRHELTLAAGARRYARRATVIRSVGAAVGVVVIAAAGIVYATGSPTSQSRPVSPPTPTATTSSSPVSDVLRPFICGDPWSPPKAETPEDGIAPGAVSVRVCPIVPQAATAALRDHIESDGSLGVFSSPDDALTTGVDSFAAVVNAARPVTKDVTCDAEDGPLYALVFQYDDGTLSSVQGDAGRCNLLAGAEFGLRGDARQVLDAYTEALLDQRKHTEPRSTDAFWTSCPDHFAAARLSVLPIGPDVKLIHAVVCDYNPLFEELTGYGGLTTKQIKVINAEIAQHSRPFEPDPDAPASCPTPGTPGRLVTRMVFGYNRWGDFIGVYGGGCDSEYLLYPDWLWTPTASTEEMLGSVVNPL